MRRTPKSVPPVRLRISMGPLFWHFLTFLTKNWYNQIFVPGKFFVSYCRKIHRNPLVTYRLPHENFDSKVLLVNPLSRDGSCKGQLPIQHNCYGRFFENYFGFCFGGKFRRNYLGGFLVRFSVLLNASIQNLKYMY